MKADCAPPPMPLPAPPFRGPAGPPVHNPPLHHQPHSAQTAAHGAWRALTAPPTIWHVLHLPSARRCASHSPTCHLALCADDYLFILVLIGDSGVGKSCLLLRFAVRRTAPHAETAIARRRVRQPLPPSPPPLCNTTEYCCAYDALLRMTNGQTATSRRLAWISRSARSSWMARPSSCRS